MANRSAKKSKVVTITPKDHLTVEEMRRYLSKSVSSFNQNKVNGILAEVEFRTFLTTHGYGDRVSVGGWIARCDARGDFSFGENAAVFFPETIAPDAPLGQGRVMPRPHMGLHTICATFHQLGIHSYYCAAVVRGVDSDGLPQLEWQAVQLGLPTEQDYRPFPDAVPGFNSRRKPYSFLRYDAETAGIVAAVVPEEFSKEALRVAFASRFFGEMSDIDGLFWGQQNTYPIEVKEKTLAMSEAMGNYFGLDIGPFVKLAYYAAKRGNMHSMFVVREIDDENTRNLVAWRYITFERLAQFASWNFVAGGKNMRGGASATVRIPSDQFSVLDADALRAL